MSWLGATVLVCLLFALSCDSSGESNPEPTATSQPTAAGGSTDAAIREAYEGFIAAMNERRFDDALAAYSACQRAKTSSRDLEFGRGATGRLTLRSLAVLSSDAARALVATVVVSEIFVGTQNVFRLQVPMIYEDGGWRIDGPPPCTP